MATTLRPPARWTLHDLRRTAASGMAGMGIAAACRRGRAQSQERNDKGRRGSLQSIQLRVRKASGLGRMGAAAGRDRHGRAASNVVELAAGEGAFMPTMPKPMTADEQFTEIAERARRIGGEDLVTSTLASAWALLGNRGRAPASREVGQDAHAAIFGRSDPDMRPLGCVLLRGRSPDPGGHSGDMLGDDVGPR